MPKRTQRGKWVIYRADDGERLERWPIDARAMLETDEFVAEPPDGGGESPAPAAEPESTPESEPEPKAQEEEAEPQVIGLDAEKASRLREQWDKATPPAEYIDRYGEDTDAGQLARKILDAEEAAKGAPQNVTGEAGEAQPVSLPESRG